MVQILVVEDEVVVGLALREDLREAGGHVIVAHDAESGLQHLSSTRFDAAIIDIALPGMRGDDLARHCRLNYPDMALILATGLDEREVRASFKSDSKSAVLEKPHDFYQVRACLERLGIRLPSNSEPTPT